MSAHIAPKSLYFAIFGALLIFTGITVGVAYIDLGIFNTGVAMAIAVTKASLVVLFFMHGYWSERLVKMTIVISLVFFATLVAFAMGDYLTRGLLGVAGK